MLRRIKRDWGGCGERERKTIPMSKKIVERALIFQLH